MDPVLPHSLDDGASKKVEMPYAAALSVEVGNLPPSGDLIDGLDGKACRFTFAYGEMPVRGEVRPGEDKVELELLMEVGVVPYTVESREARGRLLEAVRSFRGKCPEGVEVDRDQSIFVRGTVLLEAPVTATRLISSIIAMLFDIKPVLRSLGDHLPALAQAIPGWDHATETIGAAPEAQAPSSAG